MKKRIENLTYRGNTTTLAELEVMRVWVESPLNENGKRTAHTYHKASSVYTVNEEEVVELIKEFNLEFEYNGGDLFDEALASIVEHISES